ncbi:MAG TPA: hypothetical protein VG818_11475 [Gemmatimonadaceae bacterium]|jgi:hypothetical protein|nr:hypothetical protein [Gemmatimonadaceae bacterium]
MRSAVYAAALVALAMPLASQASAQGMEKDPTNKVQGGQVPAGWHIRLDDKDMKRFTTNDTKFVAMEGGYHVTSGPAAIYYNPANSASGNYTVTGSFTQVKAPMHPEAYGIFVGGSNLETPNQNYLYFLVRGTGEYLINHRAGADVHKIVNWTASDAIVKQNDKGVATNTLSIEAQKDSVRFMVNGKLVKVLPRAAVMSSEGIAGIRVNHNLDVHIGSFSVKK